MVLLGGGLGLTTAPATDSIMGVVKPEQAGAGSAVNDATRQIGGTLGVAVIGSIFSTLYINRLTDSTVLQALPGPPSRPPATVWRRVSPSPRSHPPRSPGRCATTSATRSCPACTPAA